MYDDITYPFNFEADDTNLPWNWVNLSDYPDADEEEPQELNFD